MGRTGDDLDGGEGSSVVHGLDLTGAASVSTARDFVRDALLAALTNDEDDANPVVETAALLVSELATNAVLHARSGYRVQVVVNGATVRVSVLDNSPVLVHRRVNRLDAATGRGLGLVETLAERWGRTDGDELGSHAKGVWFELPTDPRQLRAPDEGGLFGSGWLALADDL